jgi:hypothetical protein
MRFLFIISLFAGLVLLGCASDPPKAASRPAPDGDLREQYEACYRAWQEKVERDFSTSSLGPEVYRKCDEYERLVALGPRAVPFFIKELEGWAKFKKDGTFARGDAFLLDDAVGRIVHKKFEDWADVLAWWQSRADVPLRFRQAYEQWKRAKADGQSVLQVDETVFDERTKRLQTRQTRTELGKAYFAIRDLGIDALPFLVETLKAGDYDLLPINAEVGGWRAPPERAGTLAEQAKEALEFWEKYREELLLPPAPAAPQKEQKP